MSRKEETPLPDLQPGEALTLQQLEPVQHFTKPTPRFGEASLVKELEKLGIERPSTYASIISTIRDRGYESLNNRRFYAEKIGELVTDRLSENFDNLMDYGFTAGMEEEQLNKIAHGEAMWNQVLDNFTQTSAKLDQAQALEGGMRPNAPTDTSIECPTCGRHMQVRNGSTGLFGLFRLRVEAERTLHNF